MSALEKFPLLALYWEVFRIIFPALVGALAYMRYSEDYAPGWNLKTVGDIFFPVVCGLAAGFYAFEKYPAIGQASLALLQAGVSAMTVEGMQAFFRSSKTAAADIVGRLWDFLLGWIPSRKDKQP